MSWWQFCRRSENLVVEVRFLNGRTISVPLAWYPRLLHGSIEERNDCFSEVVP
ncbi:DUF2442 domain-containing protein [Sodalinema gerasimenkoae]|uniref:DUF2442 domain-containing protein n=1 Tax=Sodalinema gerasimenkoae TaxID=2862348 RepID=UPI001C64207E